MENENKQDSTTTHESQADRPMESLKERSRREKRQEKKGKKSPKWVALFWIGLIGVLLLGAFLYKRYAPGKTVMPLTEFFDAPKDEVLLMLHDTVLEETAIYEREEMYLPYQVVVDHINQRFYFDSSENTLSYVAASQLIRTEVGDTFYYVNKSKVNKSYAIVKMQGEEVYLALDFVKEFSNVTFDLYEQPDRLMIEAGWGSTYEYYTVKHATKLRYKPGIKCDILESLDKGDVLRVVKDDTQELESYAKVMTKDGVTGYVLKRKLSDLYEEKLTNDYTADVFSHITRDKTINMVWHQVTNSAANDGLLNLLANTKGVNVVSPTWYSIADNSGNLSSLASETYVQRAHSNGMEVWALCDDFKAAKGEISLEQVLGNTTNRDKLINGLLATAIQYNLDGINIDFENVKKDTAPAYLEFLRELSIKCRVNGIVLSVDSYVPSEYTTYYDREEQGKVVDYVVVMAYDEHFAGSEESGSVASIGFVQDAVEQITQMVDPAQVIIGMPFYTRLWKEQTTEEGVKISSSAHGMAQAENILSSHGVTAKWDKTTGQNYGQFEADGCVYKIWLEDTSSIEQKLKVIFAKSDKGEIAGISCWKLGLEKSDVWNIIMKYVN